MRKKASEYAELEAVSVDAWREMYWGLNSGYPSCDELGDRFGVSGEYIRNLLDRRGITRRSKGEQMLADWRGGKRPPAKGWPKGGDIAEKRARMLHARATPGSQSKARAAAIQSTIRRGAAMRVIRPCGWCGAPVSRVPSEAARLPRSYCDLSHCNRDRNYRLHHGTDAPRPFIVQRLTELNRGYPNTYERLEKIGAQIGAREPEIFAVMGI